MVAARAGAVSASMAFPDGRDAFGGDIAAFGFGGLGEQAQTFLVAFQHCIQQGGGAGGGGLLHLGHAGAGGEADIAAIHRQVARDGFQQRRFPGAVAAHQADAPASVNGEVRTFQKGAAAHAQGDAGDDQEAHGRGLQCGAALVQVEGGRVFFFEKKNQKTFAPLRVLPATPRQRVKSLLLLFFRKEDLSFLVLQMLSSVPLLACR
jgi:hypothetical protein